MFNTDGTTLVDGATGTELGRRGVDISIPLWSARAIIEAPDVLERIHRDYLDAGATAVTTCTFRTHRRSLQKAGRGDQARSLTEAAVACAIRARDAVAPQALVMGSVAPLEDCYRPDLVPFETACHDEHADLIGHLVGAGVDLVLIETMCSAREAAAAMRAAQSVSPDAWAISFCFAEEGAACTLLDGTSIDALGDQLADAAFVGVNCTSPDRTLAHVKALKRLLGDRPVAARANIGYARDDGSWVSTDAVQPEIYAEHARRWEEAGASIVGGCCGTTPATIAAMASMA